jgi:hypothetical protein
MVLFASLTGVVGAADNAAPIVKQLPLDERIVYEIPIATDAPTTLMFPSAPSALEGANITNNPDNPAPVLLSHLPGRYYLSVRALKPDARATLNVIHQNRTYIVRFVAVNAANAANGTDTKPYGSVTFYETRSGSRHGTGSTAKRPAPEMLLALLDRAKSYRLIQQQYPEAVQHIELRAPTAPENVTPYRDFIVTLDEVYRFEAEDTLVFKITLTNLSDAEIAYQPQSLAVRVGNRLYPAAIADASGLIPPRAETTAFFAISGSPDGGRANLSLKNNFVVIVPRVTRDAQLIAPR